jgi:hypothetical protein
LIVSLKKEHTETYYVVAEDQMLGPFDKRTITGMRVKKTLLNDSLICDSQGNYTTVIELLGNPLPLGRSSGGSDTSGAYHPHFAVTLLKPHVRDYADLELRGDGEVRILSDVVRVAASVKRSLWGRAEPARARVPHWHLEQLDCIRDEVVLFAPQSIAQSYHGSIRMKFKSTEEASAFSDQARQIMPWLL